MTRRTPLKRGPWRRASAPPKPRRPLRQQSKAKGKWAGCYSRAKADRMRAQIEERGSTFCERCRENGPVDGHHPGGQIGAAIMRFFLICRRCHDWIHEHGREARDQGWLER